MMTFNFLINSLNLNSRTDKNIVSLSAESDEFLKKLIEFFCL